MMAVRLFAPEPVRARSKIVQFDIAAAMVQSLVAGRRVTVENDDREFDAAPFEPDETNQVKRWGDFGSLMTAGTNSAGLQVDTIRTTILGLVSGALEWDIRPVGASADDPDSDGGWALKGTSPSRLAGDLARQWGELPMVGAVA